MQAITGMNCSWHLSRDVLCPYSSTPKRYACSSFRGCLAQLLDVLGRGKFSLRQCLKTPPLHSCTSKHSIGELEPINGVVCEIKL